MKLRVSLGSIIAVLSAGAAFAGIVNSTPVPTLGEAGVVMLAIGLVGGGIAALRRRSR